jgi:hypothetical protein
LMYVVVVKRAERETRHHLRILRAGKRRAGVVLIRQLLLVACSCAIVAYVSHRSAGAGRGQHDADSDRKKVETRGKTGKTTAVAVVRKE